MKGNEISRESKGHMKGTSEDLALHMVSSSFIALILCKYLYPHFILASIILATDIVRALMLETKTNY